MLDYRKLAAGIRKLPPPRQPWLALKTAVYTEKIACWNRGAPGRNALFYEFSTGARTVPCPMVPDGCLNILFRCGTEPAVIIAGIHDGEFRLDLEPNSLYFGCRPLFLSGLRLELFGVSPGMLANRVITLAANRIRSMAEPLFRNAVFQERIDFFAGSVAPLLADREYVPDLAGFCAAMARIHGGKMAVSDIARESGYTQRHCRQSFGAAFGLSIKRYNRIVRFQRVLGNIIGERGASLAGIAERAGFYDPSHFDYEFRKMTRHTPKRFRELYLTLSGEKGRLPARSEAGGIIPGVRCEKAAGIS